MSDLLALHETLAGILKRDPDLHWQGYELTWDERQSAALVRLRRETLEPHSLNQFRWALRFLRVAPRTRSIGRQHCTYWWKHVAEAWTQAVVNLGASGGSEVSEGVFIAACIANGLSIIRTRSGTYVNLSARGPKDPWSLISKPASGD